jgi:hypothetical protein
MQAALETLAKMAARSAGYDPEHGLAGQAGGLSEFDGPAWQHPQFLALAETAHAILTAPPFPKELNSAAHQPART